MTMTLLAALLLGVMSGFVVGDRARVYATLGGLWIVLLGWRSYQAGSTQLANGDYWVFPLLILALAWAGIWLGARLRHGTSLAA
jgi:hypothetical protein